MPIEAGSKFQLTVTEMSNSSPVLTVTDPCRAMPTLLTRISSLLGASSTAPGRLQTYPVSVKSPGGCVLVSMPFVSRSRPQRCARRAQLQRGRSTDAAPVTSACFPNKSIGPDQNDATGAPNSAASGLMPSPGPSGRAMWPSTTLTGLAGS